MNELILAFGERQDLSGTVNGAAYRTKCWLGLKKELKGLTDEDRNVIQPILEASGCWEPLQFKEGEEERVVPIEMI